MADRGAGRRADPIGAAGDGAEPGERRRIVFAGGRADEPALVLDLDGYEGPIDLLLALAREQKVDLAKLSILALADQYLAFIAAQQRLRLEIAADYLVMAAWLAYLKSRLLLPEPPAEDDGPSGDELAAALRHRLRLLEAMQRAGARADGASAARAATCSCAAAPEGLPTDRPAGLRPQPL